MAVAYSTPTNAAQQNSRPAAQMSDNSLVFLVNTTSTWTLYHTSDRSTITSLGTLDSVFGSATNVSVCVDAADNIYVSAPNTYGSQYVQAFKAASGAWTAQTHQTLTFSATFSNGIGPVGLRWMNLGGTAGAGQLVIAQNYSSSGSTTGATFVILCDAGPLLAGTSPASTATSVGSTYSGGTSNTVGNVCIDIVTDGFGGTGVWIAGQALSGTTQYPSVAYYKFTTNNTIPAAAWGAVLETATAMYGHLAPIAAGQCAWVGQALNSTAGYVAVAGTSALTVAATAFTAPVTTAINFDVAYNPVASVLEVFLWDSSVAADLANYTLNASTSPSPSAATVLQAAAVFTGQTPNRVWATDVMRQATADYFVVSNTTFSGAYVQYATPPAAPTLTSPSNAGYTDVVSGVTLTGTYNSTDTFNQNAYACRVKLSGSGTYSYWNASLNALQSTIVWNPTSTAPAASFSASLAAAAVSDAHTYNWSLASQEAGDNLQGPFAADFTFNSQAAPVLTVNAPTGLEGGTTSPTVTWTTSPPAGASQTAYQVIVEHGTYTTTPGSGTQDWTAGVVTSSAQLAHIGATLINGTTYRAFVQVTETGGQVSTWGYVTFTVNLDGPASPTVYITPTDGSVGQPTLIVAVTGHDNLLSTNDASFETNVGTWVSNANCTVARTAAHGLDGSASLAVTSVAAGTMSAKTGSTNYPCTPGQTLTGLASFMAATAGRSCQTNLSFFDGSGTFLSTVAGAAVTSTTGGWTQATVTTVAPTGAVYVAVRATVTSTAAAGEVHYVDEASVAPGTGTAWSRGGLVGAITVDIWARTAAASTVVDPQRPNPAGVRLAAGITPNAAQWLSWTDRAAASGCVYEYMAAVTGSSITTLSAWTT